MLLNVNGIKLHTIETDQYKTNTIILKLKAPINGEEVTTRALLPYVLQSGTKSLPSTLKIRSYLDDLYGASLFVDVGKKGEYHIITFRLDITNELYLKDQTPLLQKAIQFISEIVLSPVTEGEGFSPSIVEKEKRSLHNRIQSIYDDKMRYANMRLIEEMCENEPYRFHPYGKLEDLKKITPKSLYNYYQKALVEDEVDLYIIGDINTENVLSLVKDHVVFPTVRSNQFSKANSVSKQPAQERTIIEQQDVKQGKLHIGYRTNITYGDDDYFALQLFNGLFGGFSHSKLFINVREKESLAYYAASRVESHKGLLMVMSGIEFENYEKAVNIIKEQMEHMKAGNFTDDEITQTKSVIKNQILETVDTTSGIVELLYHNVVAGVSRSLHDWLENIDKVSKEDVQNVANNIYLDTIYFLKGMESA